MPKLVRVGDVNEAGGRVLDGASTVFVNGKMVGTHVSAISPHPPCGSKGGHPHCTARTTRGSSTVFAGGKPVLFVGVSDTCGHTQVEGSGDVVVGE